jgi:hypothetical protein
LNSVVVISLLLFSPQAVMAQNSPTQDLGHPEDSVHHQDSSKAQLGRSDQVQPPAVWKKLDLKKRFTIAVTLALTFGIVSFTFP